MGKDNFVAKFCFALAALFTLFVIFTPDNFFLQKPINNHYITTDVKPSSENFAVSETPAMSESVQDDVEHAVGTPAMSESAEQQVTEEMGTPTMSETAQQQVVEEVAAEQVPTEDVTVEQEPTEEIPVEQLDDFVHITMQVQDGKVFNFDFSPSKSSLDALASDFCFKHGAAFGVTQNNMRQGCVEPVVAYLRSQIPAEAQQTASQSNVKKVALTIDNKEVVFSVDLNDQGSAEVNARSFCVQRGHEFGVTADTMGDCVQKVYQTLAMQIQQIPSEEAPQGATA